MLCCYLDLWTSEPCWLLPPAGGAVTLRVLLLLSTKETPWQIQCKKKKKNNEQRLRQSDNYDGFAHKGCFLTLSWRKCWKWFCARRSMSLTSVSSTPFSLQTDTTFLERDTQIAGQWHSVLLIIRQWFLIKEIQTQTWVFLFNTWESSVHVVCAVPLRDHRCETSVGGVSVNAVGRSFNIVFLNSNL